MNIILVFASMDKKRPRTKFRPESGKEPRNEPLPDYSNQYPSWSFRRMDINGPWCFYKDGANHIKTIIEGLRPYEDKLWKEIPGDRDHAIKRKSLCQKAQNRLKEIGLDDTEEVFSIHLGSLPRVIGIRDGAVLRLLWWDIKHEVCPSHKKGN
jgi:hypothetical protein